MTYLHFAYAIRGRPFLILREGLALCGYEYSDLENAENNLSSFVEKINTFLQLGGERGKCQFFPKFSASFARNS